MVALFFPHEIYRTIQSLLKLQSDMRFFYVFFCSKGMVSLQKLIACLAAIIGRKLYGSADPRISSGKKCYHFFSDLKSGHRNSVENRFYVCSCNVSNTGPIPIIFGSLKPQKIELSFFLGIAMLPVI